MRLWHYKLIPFLPNSQLIAQWRELNSIFKNQPKHILINYVYEYPKEELYIYTLLIGTEMRERKIKMTSFKNLRNYFKDMKEESDILAVIAPRHNTFANHHTDRYLLQCFYNLQEKYDRGQKDFSGKEYKKLEKFMKGKGLI